jgi:two-component system LytT family response regulator
VKHGDSLSARLRVVIADDERPARSFLAGLLREWDDVDLVGEAATGNDAIDLIERVRPDLVLLDLQMPEKDGLAVVAALDRATAPMVAFVTAHDDYAVQAFELSAIDYLLKPVEPARLRKTLSRAHERLERADLRQVATDRLEVATAMIGRSGSVDQVLRRIPVRKGDDVILVPVNQLASVIADGELLHLHTLSGEHHTITFRLKDLEERLDPAQFVRLSRGIIARIDAIQRVSPMPGGTYIVALSNRQQLAVSRLRARVLRDQLLRL